MEATNRQQFLYLAKVAHEIEHYSDAMEFLSSAASRGGEPELEEASLLSRAFYSLYSPKRQAFRLRMEAMRKMAVPTPHEETETVLISKLHSEIKAACEQGVAIIKLNQGKPVDSLTQLHYLKLEGDIHRYLCELMPPSSSFHKTQALAAISVYLEADRVAQQTLGVAAPLRLSTRLNLATYYYTIANDANKAVQLLRQAVDEVSDPQEWMESEANVTAMLIERMKENLSDWEAETD